MMGGTYPQTQAVTVGNMGLSLHRTGYLDALADLGLILRLCCIHEPNQTGIVLHKGSEDKQDTQPSLIF